MRPSLEWTIRDEAGELRDILVQEVGKDYQLLAPIRRALKQAHENKWHVTSRMIHAKESA